MSMPMLQNVEQSGRKYFIADWLLSFPLCARKYFIADWLVFFPRCANHQSCYSAMLVCTGADLCRRLRFCLRTIGQCFEEQQKIIRHRTPENILCVGTVHYSDGLRVVGLIIGSGLSLNFAPCRIVSDHVFRPVLLLWFLLVFRFCAIHRLSVFVLHFRTASLA